MILMLTKVKLSMSQPLDMELGISDLFGFDPDAVFHALVNSKMDVASILVAFCRELPPPSKLLNNSS